MAKVLEQRKATADAQLQESNIMYTNAQAKNTFDDNSKQLAVSIDKHFQEWADLAIKASKVAPAILRSSVIAESVSFIRNIALLLLVVVIIRSIDMLDINILGKNHKQSEFGFGSLYGTASESSLLAFSAASASASSFASNDLSMRASIITFAITTPKIKNIVDWPINQYLKPKLIKPARQSSIIINIMCGRVT